MKRLPLLVSVVAILAAVGVLIVFLTSKDASRPVTTLPELMEREQRPDTNMLSSPHPQGGVYGGIVVDQDGEPIHGAQVALGLYQARGRDLFAGEEVDPEAPLDKGVIGKLPVIGEIQMGPRTSTDKSGRWRIAAGPRDYVHGAFAWDKRYFPGVCKIDKPRDDYRIELEGAGRVIGTVVDEETGEPVANARVDVYIQNWAPQVSAEAVKNVNTHRVKKRPLDPRVAYLRIFKDELRTVIWGEHTSTNPQQPGETIRLRTDRAGRFEIAPLGGDGLQFEFIITHPEYKWHDHDTNDGKQQARRTTLEAGQVIERTFKLKRGLEVSGVVKDENGNPIEGVRVECESISAYFKHWWYKFRERLTLTDSQGRFRLAGLAIGRQNLTFIHGSFGRHVEPGIEAPAKSLDIVIATRGGLTGTVAGLSERPLAGRIRVAMTRRSEGGAAADVRQEQTFLLGKDNRFQWSRVEPGTYEVEITAVTRNEQLRTEPRTVVIEPSQVAEETFDLAVGGSVRVEVVDRRGRIIDPTRADLERKVGSSWRQISHVTGAEGELVATTLLPGTYRFVIRAPGYVTRTTEAFEITGPREHEIERQVLDAWAWSRIVGVFNSEGRAPRRPTVVEIREGAEGDWQRFYQVAGRDRPTRPGKVWVRARVEGGTERFERQYEVLPEDILQIEIRLAPPEKSD